MGEVTYPTAASYTRAEGYTVDAQPTGNTSFVAQCMVNAKFEALQECLPVSCGVPLFVSMTAGGGGCRCSGAHPGPHA